MTHSHGINVLGAEKVAPGQVIPGEPWKAFLWRTYKAPIIASAAVGCAMGILEINDRVRKYRRK